MVCATCGKTFAWETFRDHICQEIFEPDADKLRRELAEAKNLNQRLMTALEVVGKLCNHRAHGKCLFDCPGMMVCTIDGLEKIR